MLTPLPLPSPLALSPSRAPLSSLQVLRFVVIRFDGDWLLSAETWTPERIVQLVLLVAIGFALKVLTGLLLVGYSASLRCEGIAT